MRFFNALWALCLSLCFVSGVFADDDAIIEQIDVRGNVSVSKQVVLSQIQTQIGDLLLREVLNEDLRRLYRLGYFSDISVEVDELDEGVKVTFVVEEKLSIGSISITGNKAFRDSVIMKNLDIAEGEVYNQRLVGEALSSVIDLYHKKGFYNVQIEPQAQTNPETRRIDLTLVVTEENRIAVKDITFSGNDSVSTKKLLKAMNTKKKWIFGGGRFKQETLEEDLIKIEQLLKRQGYLNAKVQEPVITYNEKGNLMFIHIPLSEGQQYRVGIVEVHGNDLFPVEDIAESLTMPEGELFSQEGLITDQRAIQSFYAEKGYIFAAVKPSTYINEETLLVDVTYRIQENELAYVEKIIIQGNLVTKDQVIRRNLTIKPLEPFDGEKLKRSREKLYNLNYFEDVQFDTLPGSEDNLRDLLINVKEKKTGQFSFGGGYSSIDQLVGFVEISQNNFDIANFPSFVGAGQRLRLRAELGGSRQSYDIGFTEPWFGGRPLLVGFNIFDREFDRDEYDEQRRGVVLRFGHPVGEYNYFNTSLKHEQVDIVIQDRANAPQTVILEEGSKSINSITFALSRDTTDSAQFPTRGQKHSISVEWAGGPLGEDVDIVKTFASTDWFFETWDKWILQLKGRIGTIDAYDDTDSVPTYERFFAGGATSIRGYEERHVGPQDAFEPVGGSSVLILNAEYTFPVFDPIRGAVFADAGNVWEDENDWQLDDLRKGVGLGVRIKTPLGPVKLDYGFALDALDTEDDSRLHFSMGGVF